jgi:hypothetical protein
MARPKTRFGLLVSLAACVVAGFACSGSGDSGSNQGAGGSAGGVRDAGSLPGNTISGSVMGTSFTTVASSYWIGHPSAGSPPTQVYLSDQELPCQSLALPGWDKTLATSSQLLEIDLAGSALTTYRVGTDADANYVGGAFNPTASGGTVTLTAVNPSQNIVGSFDIQFDTTALMGTFDGSFCADGVEP